MSHISFGRPPPKALGDCVCTARPVVPVSCFSCSDTLRDIVRSTSQDDVFGNGQPSSALYQDLGQKQG